MAGGPASSGGGIGPASAPKSRLSGILMTAFAAFGGILYGYDTGTISGIIAMDDWLATFGNEFQGDKTAINPEGRSQSTGNESLVVSILSAGTFFGMSNLTFHLRYPSSFFQALSAVPPSPTSSVAASA